MGKYLFFDIRLHFFNGNSWQGLESENDQEAVQFGTYEFLENGSNLQYFPVQAKDFERLHNIVELRIESNHGNMRYTCLYRFRVHGTPNRD